MSLYGIQARTACSGTSSMIPNYKGAWACLDKLQAIKQEKQNDFGLFPRLTASTQRVQYVPFRLSPKNVVHQIKDSGEEKDRATTDAGARRQEREHMDSARQQRVHIGQANVDGMVKAAQAFTKSSNAKPGDDSPNALYVATAWAILWYYMITETRAGYLADTRVPVCVCHTGRETKDSKD